MGSDVISRKFALMVDRGELRQCIAWLEEGLRSVRRTPYHRVLGKDFLQHSASLAHWLADFRSKSARGGLKLAAIYLEMNGFTINPRQWHCGIFGYKKASGLCDLDWLAEWDVEQPENFVLRGMESLQEVFGSFYLSGGKTLSLELAEDMAEHLVTARFMELVAAAHRRAKRRDPGLRGLPVLATAHDWDTVNKTE